MEKEGEAEVGKEGVDLLQVDCYVIVMRVLEDELENRS